MYIYMHEQHIQTNKKFHVYLKIYVPLGGRQRNYSEFIEAGSRNLKGRTVLIKKRNELGIIVNIWYMVFWQ